MWNGEKIVDERQRAMLFPNDGVAFSLTKSDRQKWHWWEICAYYTTHKRYVMLGFVLSNFLMLKGTQTNVVREVIWHRSELHMSTHTIGKILS